jgi:succinate-acetate transporter protein
MSTEARDTRREGATEQAGERAPKAPPIADPAPLGLAAFALTTFMLSLYNAKILPEEGEPIVFGLALFYGGIAQFIAGVWEFRNNNTFGATAFCSYGAFWLSFWAFEVFYLPQVPEAAADMHLGWFLLAWGIFTAYMWVASFKVSGAINIVFLVLTGTFFLLALGHILGMDALDLAGGYLGIITALGAWYASFATVVNPTFGRTVLPVKELE